jgi:predicted  nucleic acid-binding Zn-ribbon protein
MNADLERIIALQQQDLEGKRLREELADAPKRVAAAETALKKAQTAAAAAADALKKEEVLRRGQENDVKDRRGKILRLQKQMESATSAAQITALEHEIKFAEAAISKLEDDEIASMERTETQEAALANATTATAAATFALTTERERAATVLAHNTEALKAVEAQRATLRAAIAENLLAHYDRVAKARGTGISEAVNHQCSACQMMVRPQRWNDLTDTTNNDAVFSCESCGRLLYWDPRRDAPVDWKPGQVTPPR